MQPVVRALAEEVPQVLPQEVVCLGTPAATSDEAGAASDRCKLYQPPAQAIRGKTTKLSSNLADATPSVKYAESLPSASSKRSEPPTGDTIPRIEVMLANTPEGEAFDDMREQLQRRLTAAECIAC